MKKWEYIIANNLWPANDDVWKKVEEIKKRLENNG